MAPSKKPLVAKKTAVAAALGRRSAAKPMSLQPLARRTALKKPGAVILGNGNTLHVSSLALRTNAASRQEPAADDALHVSSITAGGYTVFGSPVRPAHLTTEQIAQAIADLD